MSAKGESLFFDHSPDMLCIVGFDGYFRRVSRSVNTILGWSEAELCGRPCIDLVRPDDRETTVRQMEALGTGKDRSASRTAASARTAHTGGLPGT